jgi:4'-phosphopantetheinyl transferase EntD
MQAEPCAESRWPAAINEILETWLPQDGAARCVAASLDFDVPAADVARIANAILPRRAEFISGRWCAHAALGALGVRASSLPRNILGGPVWPDGVTGSITHESGFCAAAVVRSSFARGIGIDLFDLRHQADIQQIAHLILGPEERPLLDTCEDATGFIQLIFSIKEAVVKAVSPTARRYLDMHEISLSVGADSFTAKLMDSNEQIAGKWTRIGPFLLTFAVFAPLQRICRSKPGGESVGSPLCPTP